MGESGWGIGRSLRFRTHFLSAWTLRKRFYRHLIISSWNAPGAHESRCQADLVPGIIWVSASAHHSGEFPGVSLIPSQACSSNNTPSMAPVLLPLLLQSNRPGVR